MPLPIARVIQQFQSSTTTAIEPTFKNVVVAPHVHVRTYASNRSTLASDTHLGEDILGLMTTLATVSPTIASISISDYPDNKTGAVVVDSSVKMYAEGYIEVAAETDCTGTYQQNTLTTTAGDFSACAAGDRVVIESEAVQVFEDTTQDFIGTHSVVAGVDFLVTTAGTHDILAVLSEHRLLISKATGVGLFAAAATGVTYSLGVTGPGYTDKINAATTGVQSVWKEVKLFQDANTDFSAAGVKAGHYLKIGTDIHLIASLEDDNTLKITGGTSFTSPQTRGEFASPDASANVAYSIGTTSGLFVDIVSALPTGTGQRLQTNTVVRTIYTVDSTTQITLTQFLPFHYDTGTSYRVRAEHAITNGSVPTGADGWEVTGITVNATTKAITVAANPTVTYASASRKIIDATLYIQYNSLRQEYTAAITVIDPDTLDAVWGEDSSSNVLRRAAGIAVANAGAAKVYALACATDDQTGHSAAQSVLGNDKTVYGIAPMTQDVSVLTSYKTHALSYSTPTRAKRRIILCQPGELPTSKSLVSASTDGDAQSGTSFFSAGSNFVTAGIIPTDILTVATATTENEYAVSKVDSGNYLTIAGTFTAGEQTGPITSFTVTRTLDEDAQVTELNLISKSFNDRRVVCHWPDKTVVGTDTSEPGFYQCAQTAGLIAALPSHRMTTKIGTAGIDELKNSNTVFSLEQLEALADGGWYVQVQDSVQSAPYAIQQHTSVGGSADPADKYLSSVKNFDYVSNVFQGIVDEYPAQWNVIEDLASSLETSLENQATILQGKKVPKLGAPLTSLISLRVEFSATQADKVEAYMRIKLPTVLNELDLYLVSV